MRRLERPRCLVAASLVLASFPACRGGAPLASRSDAGTIRWAAETGTLGLPDVAPAVAPDGTVFASGSRVPEAPPAGYAGVDGFRQASVYAFDPSGQLRSQVDGSVYDSSQLLSFRVWVEVTAGGAAYAVDGAGGVYAMWPSGEVLFRSLGAPVAGPLAIGAGGRLFVGGPGGVRGLDAQGLELLGFFWSTDRSHASPVALAADGTMYVTSTYGGRLYALDQSGTVIWVERGNAVVQPVLDAQGNLYLASATALRSLAPTGQLRWEVPLREKPLGRPVLGTGGNLHLLTTSGRIETWNAANRHVWTYAMQTAGASELAIREDGTLFATDLEGMLYAVDPEGRGRRLLRLPCRTSRPAVSGSSVYANGKDGKLYAIDIR